MYKSTRKRLVIFPPYKSTKLIKTKCILTKPRPICWWNTCQPGTDEKRASTWSYSAGTHIQYHTDHTIHAGTSSQLRSTSSIDDFHQAIRSHGLATTLIWTRTVHAGLRWRKLRGSWKYLNMNDQTSNSCICNALNSVFSAVFNIYSQNETQHDSTTRISLVIPVIPPS